MEATISLAEIYSILYHEHRDPFQILGAHEVTFRERKTVAIRCFLPLARQAWIVALDNDKRYPLKLLHEAGFYEAICDDRQQVFRYQIARSSTTATLPPFTILIVFCPG